MNLITSLDLFSTHPSNIENQNQRCRKVKVVMASASGSSTPRKSSFFLLPATSIAMFNEIICQDWNNDIKIPATANNQIEGIYSSL